MNYLLRNPHFKMAWVDLAVTIGAIIGMALIVTCIYLAARMCCCIWPTCGKPGKWHKKPNGNIDIGVIKQPCCLCCHIWADTGTHFLLHLRISNLAVPHLVEWIPNAYGPRTFGPPQWVPNLLVPLDKQSPTNSVPMDKLSPKIWSPWTNGPQKFSPHGQMVPL